MGSYRRRQKLGSRKAGFWRRDAGPTRSLEAGRGRFPQTAGERLLVVPDNLVNQAVVLGLIGRHKEIAVSVLFNTRDRLTCVFG